jgi:hypothetical protein
MKDSSKILEETLLTYTQENNANFSTIIEIFWFRLKKLINYYLKYNGVIFLQTCDEWINYWNKLWNYWKVDQLQKEVAFSKSVWEAS